MSDKDLIQALSGLESKMIKYTATQSVLLSAAELQLMQKIYPEMQKRSMNQLPRVFNTGCSTCIKEVLSVYISFYFRVKAELDEEETTQQEPVIAVSGNTQASAGVNKNKKRK